MLGASLADNRTAGRCLLCNSHQGAARLRGEPQSAVREGLAIGMHDSAQAASLVLRGTKVSVATPWRVMILAWRLEGACELEPDGTVAGDEPGEG